MKLKKLLFSVFLALTLIPTVIIAVLFYKSGYRLSEESYTKNLVESINVQADYISQTIENNRVEDLRFADHSLDIGFRDTAGTEDAKKKLYEACKFYLETSEDKIAVCMMLDQEGELLYSIGEQEALAEIRQQLPKLEEVEGQIVQEFVLGDQEYSIGVITQVRNAEGSYLGSLIAVYDRSYMFKIISSYYKISDTATYICRSNGDIINFSKFSDEKKNQAVQEVLEEMELDQEGIIDRRTEETDVLGYYKSIQNSPWYLVGFVDYDLIYSFANQFLVVYIVIIFGLIVLDLLFALLFSGRVVKPINDLIGVMEAYPSSLNVEELEFQKSGGYYETKYLYTKFMEMLKKILLVQHNFQGIYQLYQSNDMGDINIDIDVKNQVVTSNKKAFQELLDGMELAEGECVVERFNKCFSEKDKGILMDMMENMRDTHLAVMREAEVYTPNLGEKWFHTVIVPMYEEERLSRLFIQLRDISSFKKQEFKSFEQARRDPLTGLLNRSGFAGRVEEILADGKKEDLHALLFIDMNYFKMVNDNFGHGEGDELLCKVGQTILQNIRTEDVAARMGGDEFAVFLPCISEMEMETVKQRLNAKLVFPYHTEKVTFEVSASIGMSAWRQTSSDTLEDILQQADASMYRAKREFKEGMSADFHII